MSRQLCDNPFEPQLPPLLLAMVPPLVIASDVLPLIATKDMLPVAWVERNLRATRLDLRDQRREASLAQRVDRIVGLMVTFQCPKCRRRGLHVRLDGNLKIQECHYTSCRYFQMWMPMGQSWEPRPFAELYPGFAVVTLPSRYPSRAYLMHLVSHLGYDLVAAMSTLPRRYGVQKPKPTKQPLPEATRESLMKALSRRRYKDPNMRQAVVSVIGGAAVRKVANRYRLDEGELGRNVAQIRQTMM